MENNQDLQATYQILKIFEVAKAHGDQILDHIPGLYAVFSPTGEIHRGNLQLAYELDVDFETLHLHDMNELMTPSQWIDFQEKIAAALTAQNAGIDFEMDMNREGLALKSYFFNIRASLIDRLSNSYVLTLLGQEVTQVKLTAVEFGRMQGELNTAKEVQESLFIESNFNNQKCSISASYTSASECGGDWWYYNQIGERMFVWIGDVTGHGVAAALVTAAARASVSLIERDPSITPLKALKHLNWAVSAVSQGKKLMSFFIASIDLKTGECEYANAGHPAPIHINKTSAPPETSDLRFLPLTASTLLGMIPDPHFEEGKFNLKSGDTLFAYTDGVTEIENEREIAFGDRRLFKALLESEKASLEIEAMKTKLTKTLTDFQGSAPLPDDQTFLIFKLK